MSDTLLPQAEWDEDYANYSFAIAPPNEPLRQWLAKHFAGNCGTCLELGCFPGRFLAVFGELGYEIHGIDLTPRVDTDMRDWLRKQGYKTGQIIRGDACKFDFGRLFGTVCSFGFIEHFFDWEDVVRRHAALVEPGGTLVLTVPNFRSPVQNVLHRALDAENLSKHNIEAMDLGRWRSLVESLGFQVIECGGIGPFEFWIGQGRRNFVQKAFLKILRHLAPVLRQLLPENSLQFSSYYGLIARKSAY